MTRRRQIVMVALSLISSALLAWMSVRRPDHVTLGTAHVGTPFHLISAQGLAVDEASLHGHGFMVLFGCAKCDDTAVAALQVLAAASRNLQARNLKVPAIFIALDAEMITDGRLAAFMAPFSPPVMGLTGLQSELARVSEAYHVHASKTSDGFIQNVTSMIYVMGKHGEFLSACEPEVGVAGVVETVETVL